jgi:hypothetical protein
MFSPTLQSLVTQAHIEELHRVAQTHNLHRTFAVLTHEVDRPNAKRLSAGVTRAIERMLGGRRGPSAAIHGLELVGRPFAAPGPRP